MQKCEWARSSVFSFKIFYAAYIISHYAGTIVIIDAGYGMCH